MARRALVAQHRMPEHDRERGSQRVLELVAHLVALGWDVTFLAFETSADARYERHLAALGVPTLVGTGDGVADALRADPPEVAVVAFWHVAERLVPLLREVAPTTRIVVDTVDLHFLRDLRRRSDGPGPWVDDHAAEQLRRELNTYAAADGVLTVSEGEAELLRTLADRSLLVRSVPLAEDAARSRRRADERRGLVFVGNFRHLPNIEAVAFLCQEVLPRLDPDLLAAHPVSIVGNELDDRVRAAARHPGVRLVGWVPDVARYLADARIAVAPLLHGAGVKGKVLQSLAVGTPMVVTPVAIEGTALRAGTDVLVADGAATFARAVERLLSDGALWTQVADAGHAAVRRDHGIEVVRVRFAEALVDVLASTGPSGTGDSRRWDRHYAEVRADVRALVDDCVPLGDDVHAVTGGDADLLGARPVCHVPADELGHHTHHPVDGAAAVTGLEGLLARGARWLVLPSTAYWWLHSYPEVHAHLRTRWRLVAERPEARLWSSIPADDRPVDVLVVADAAASDEHRVEVVAELPAHGLERFERVVVAPGRRLEAPWLDRLLGAQRRLRLDVAQAAATIGSVGVPPAAICQPGVRARRTPAVVTAMPIVIGRRAIGALARALRSWWPDDVSVGIVDECPAPVHATDAPVLDGTADDLSTLDVATDLDGWQGLAPPSGSPRLSVVIATFDRSELLEQCLAGFVDQVLPTDDWELVVVDDGSADATPEVIERWRGALPMRSLRIDHAGRSAAKNAGVLAARGELVLLFDDDDVPEGDLLLQHVKAHDEDPDPTVAVLGYTDFAPGLAVTPLMRFVTEGATMLFAYHELRDGDRVGWRYFWEGRLSCKRALLVQHGLHDPRLDYSVDVELGFRLATGPGLTVVHRRAAVSHMARAFTYDEFLARMEAKGRAQHRFAELHPDPEVRAYCFIDTAEADWAVAAPTFDVDRARVGELEAVVEDQPEVLEELHRLYVRTLRGANRRGVLLAAAERPVAPSLSVVIPVWSVTPELAEVATRTVARIRDVARVPTEIVIVDNGSPNRSVFGDVVLVEHERNQGVAAAWNAGLARATAATIAIVNSDVHVEAGWDVALYAAANDGRRIAFPHTDHGDGLGPRRADQAGTAGWCFAASRAVFDELGPFDETFTPAFFEDADYWTRAFTAGIELSPVPAAVVRHCRRSSARHHPEMELLFQAHRMKYSWKHGIDPTAPPPYWHRDVAEHP